MWRFLPIDFRARSHYGPMEGSTLDDWPLSYDELEPFYDKAEYTLGVAGEDGDPFAGKRSRPFSASTRRSATGRSAGEEGSSETGLSSPSPSRSALRLRSSRTAILVCGHPCCNGFICEIGAKSTMVTALLPSTLATGNCQLITEAVVKEVTTDGRGRPDGVSYFDKSGKLTNQPSPARDSCLPRLQKLPACF
jgi:choline dehydrogenase-like flavoprotein